VSDPSTLTLTEAAAAIREHKLSSVEVTRSLLARIERWQPVLNAFVRVEVEEALAAAAAADAAIASGVACGPLHGVPLAHKDMYYITGRLAECGSKIRSGWVAPATSTAIARIQDAGAVRLGALHMAEFAYGPTGHNEHLGPARNPWDPQRITGGSSSGSAASVAANHALHATDQLSRAPCARNSGRTVAARHADRIATDRQAFRRRDGDCLRPRLPNCHEPSPPHSGLSMTQIVEARDLRVRFTGGRTAHAVNGVDICWPRRGAGPARESGSGKDVAVSAKLPDSRRAEMSGAPPFS
jgi:hypothetical protein